LTESNRQHGPPGSVGDALGGPLGIAESALPPVAFVTTYTIAGSEPAGAAWVALGIGGALALARIVRGQTVQYALTGLAGVAIAALVVSLTGRAEDYFLPGLFANAGYAAACLISILIGRPAVGILLGVLRGEGREMGWRADPALLRIYSLLTWIWVVLFSLRVAVQLPLYLAGEVVALGTARVAMGIPLTALAAWLTWLGLRGAEPARAAEREERSDPG
jgi:hypothetical protein